MSDFAWNMPMIVVVEQLSNVHEYGSLFPWLHRIQTRSVDASSSPRTRDWYTYPVNTLKEKQPVPLQFNNGPLCASHKTCAITTRTPGGLSTVALAVEQWKQTKKPRDRAWFKSVKKAAKLVREYQLYWNGHRYLLPSSQQLLRLQGFACTFADIFVSSWNTVRLEVGPIIPSARHIIGNGWNFSQALHACSHIPNEPTAVIEICSGMGAVGWILSQRFGGALSKVKVFIQVEKDPGLRRLSALIFIALRSKGILPKSTTLIQVHDAWSLVLNSESVLVQVYKAATTSEMDPPASTIDLTPVGLCRLLETHGAEYSTTAVVAGPPCNGFAGLNYAQGIGGRQRLANRESYTAFAVSLFLWKMHRHVSVSAICDQEELYLQNMQSLLGYCWRYAVESTGAHSDETVFRERVMQLTVR